MQLNILDIIYNKYSSQEKKITSPSEAVADYASNIFDYFCQALESIGCENLSDKILVKNKINNSTYENTYFAGDYIGNLIFDSEEYRDEIQQEQTNLKNNLKKFYDDDDLINSIIRKVTNILDEQTSSLDIEDWRDSAIHMLDYINDREND